MANTLTTIQDKILARGLLVLREAAVMPRLVNVDFGPDAARQGTTIDVPKPVAQTVTDVSPGPLTGVTAANTTPGLVQIPMDQWKKTNFFLTDKDMVEVDRNRHFIPGQTEEAARALANNIDIAIHNEAKGVYGFVGVAGSTGWDTVATETNARKVLTTQLCPLDSRRLVMDPDAESKALQLSAFSDLEKTGDRAVKIEGEIGRKFGFDHFTSQNVQTHTAGTAVTGNGTAVASTTAIGASSLDIDVSASTATLVPGDIFTIAGDTQTYVVQASAALSTTKAAVSIDPPLKVIASANSAVTVKATHVVNLAFHRNAFAYVTRPLLETVTDDLLGGSSVRSLADDMTGLVLRLEVTRQNKQVAWEFDILYGDKLMRPEFATRIAG